MTDNFEDIEHHEGDHMEGEQPVPKTGIRSNLAEAWRTRPLFKLLVVMVVAGAAIAAVTSFLSSGSQDQISRLPAPPDIHQAPGGQASPYFLQQTKEAERKREQDALKQGTSALPTPIGQPNESAPADNDQLNEIRAETTRLQQQLTRVQQQQQVQPPQGQGQPEHFDDSLAQAMQQQMKELMTGWSPHGIKEVSVTKEEKDGSSKAGGGAPGTGNGAGGNGATANSNAPPIKVLLSAGTLSYAQLLVEANSDVPGPILALIVSGPLSGAKAIGSFQIANGYNDYLVLHFNHANLKGKDYAIDAYALDPDTTLGGLATEVDQRYFTRVLLPTAAAFLQGFGGSIGASNSTTTVSNGLSVVSQPSVSINQGLAQGMGQAAQIASQFFQNQANQTRPLVRVAAGTPMGFFFVSSVTDQDPTQQPPPGMGLAGLPGYPGLGGYPGYGSPYGANPYGANPYGALGAGAPGAIPAGYGNYGGYGSPGGGYSSQSGYGVPYPNVGAPSAPNGYGTSLYSTNPLNTLRTGYPGQGLVP